MRRPKLDTFWIRYLPRGSRTYLCRTYGTMQAAAGRSRKVPAFIFGARICPTGGRKMPTAAHYRRELLEMMSSAENGGRTYLEISARELHALIGPPRGRNDRMPNCCRVMKAQLAPDYGDVIHALRTPRPIFAFIQRDLAYCDDGNTYSTIAADRGPSSPVHDTVVSLISWLCGAEFPLFGPSPVTARVN